MSKISKLLLIFSVLFFTALCVFRIVYGGWHDSMWVPLVLSVLLFIGAIAKDWRTVVSFFTMRTTKHGMNMGVLILLAIAGLACVNLLAVRYEKKFDWTSEKLNSLSDQSVKAAQGLKADTEVVFLYRPDTQQGGENLPRNVGDLVGMYANVTNKLKYSPYNALQRPDLAQKYEYSAGPFALYIVQGEKRVKVDQPNEEGITRGLLKLGRDTKKVAYFLVGHGERSPEESGEEGLSTLKQDLSVTYDVKTLALYQSQNKVPADAGVVAIVRPQQQFLDAEIQALRDYLRTGGHIFLAIDPGMRHNLAQLTKTVGVEFGNDYVLDLRSQLIRSGPATVLGTDFSKTNEITRAFDEGSLVIFQLASSLRVAQGSPEGLTVDRLVSTDTRTMNIPEVKDQVAFNPNGPHVIAMASKGNLGGEGAKEFAAVVVGDGDFISNRLVHNNLNRDLVLNSFASLMADKDLISIRPKQPKGTKLEMTNQSFVIYVLGFLLPLPILLFFLGGFVWWRRRGA